MAQVVGVVFKNGTKTYNFDPGELELSRGDRVVVQTMKGTEIGQVVDPPHSVEDSELPAPLKKVTRLATGKDLETVAASEGLRREAMAACRELIAEHGLDMKLVSAEVMFGGEKITFSFYAEERIDFRALVADLAKKLKMRIELRQIGAREEARAVGGLGPCGRHLCCTLFPGNEDPVSIRMAKEQNLPLNPMKISGLCGRLMCCLKYEQQQYVTFRKEAPNKGTPVTTERGNAVVIGYNVPKDASGFRRCGSAKLPGWSNRSPALTASWWRARAMTEPRTDNSDPRAKLELRRYFLRKYHPDDPPDVLDCCEGEGLLWRRLRRRVP